MVTKIKGWTESVENLTRVALKHLQSAYAGLQKSLLLEWGAGGKSLNILEHFRDLQVRGPA